MRRLFTFVLALLMLTAMFTATAYADVPVTGGDFGDGLHWEYSDGTLTITGTGDMPDYNSSSENPWDEYNTSITNIVIEPGLTYIGNNAFSNTRITSIVLPGTVSALSSSAFNVMLQSMTAPCTLKNNPNLPSGVTMSYTHFPTEIAGWPATYTTTGQIQHWKCTSAACSKLFWDAACTSEITNQSELIIPKLTDTTPPVLNGINLDRNSITVPNSVLVTVSAYDAESGIAGGSVTFTKNAQSGMPEVSCSLAANVTGILTGSLYFSNTASSGDYYISALTITDNAGNRTSYSYSTLPAAYQGIKISVVRTGTISTAGTLTLNATSVGYGGTVTGTVVLKDIYGNLLPNKTVEVYVGTVKTAITAITDGNGTATFTYSNNVPGTYSLKARFIGDTDYYGCETNTANITFTSVPSTGDSYNIQLWTFVALMGIAANVWFILRRRTA